MSPARSPGPAGPHARRRPRGGAAVIALWVGLLALVACGPPADGLTVGAASSLGELADDVARVLQEGTGHPVSVRLGASSTLARQIEQGLRIDVFLSAAPEWVDGLAVVERRPWLGNRLVWVVPADGPRPGPGDAASLALGARGVPVGDYAEQQLAALGVPLPARVVRGVHARDVLAKVREGAAEAAVVYATDAAIAPELVVVTSLPPDGSAGVRYEAALLDPRAADGFALLFDDTVLAAARSRGFTDL